MRIIEPSSMVVDKLKLFGSVVLPDETKAPLIVHANGVLSLPVTGQCLQTIAGGLPQVLKNDGSRNHCDLPLDGADQFCRKPFGRLSCPNDILKPCCLEGPDHKAVAWHFSLERITGRYHFKRYVSRRDTRVGE